MLNRKAQALLILGAVVAGLALAYFVLKPIAEHSPIGKLVVNLGVCVALVLASLFGSKEIGLYGGLGPSSVLGSEGVVVKQIEDSGQVKIGGEIWTAESSSGEGLSEGTKILVVSIEGLVVRVERAA